MTRKYKFLRPIIPKGQTKPAIEMFRYAIECVKRELKQQKTYLNLFQVPIIQQLKDEKLFKQTFKTLLAEELKRTLESQEKQIFDKTFVKLALPTIFEDDLT